MQLKDWPEIARRRCNHQTSLSAIFWWILSFFNQIRVLCRILRINTMRHDNNLTVIMMI